MQHNDLKSICIVIQYNKSPWVSQTQYSIQTIPVCKNDVLCKRYSNDGHNSDNKRLGFY